MATLADVAAQAGVSPSAVSRYLNGRVDLPLATALRIDAAVARLNYRPNALARRLSTGRTDVIGLVTPNIGNHFFGAMAAAVESEARRSGYSLTLTATGGDFQNELEALRAIRDRFVDGVIISILSPDRSGRLARSVSETGCVVLVDEDVPGVKAPRILYQNELGGYLATSYLLGAGHRRIAFVGGAPGLSTTEERLAGYRRAMAEAGAPIDDGMVRCGGYDIDDGMDHGLALLRKYRPPTAVFAGSDYLAFGVIKAARLAGSVVPTDLSVMGFGDYPFAQYVVPALTSVRIPVADAGQTAVRSLLAALRKEPVPTIERLPVELVSRASVAAPGDWEI